jgi:hypothetical protein
MSEIWRALSPGECEISLVIVVVSRRNLTGFASNIVSWHRGSAKALLSLASPCAHVAQALLPPCLVTFLLSLLETNYSLLLLGSVLRMLLALYDSV